VDYDNEIKKNLRLELASRLHGDIEDALAAFERRDLNTLLEHTRAIGITLTHLAEGLQSMVPAAAE